MSCYGVGPVLLVSPQVLDWGTVPVLCCVEKQVTIANESHIEANFSAFMVNTLIFRCTHLCVVCVLAVYGLCCSCVWSVF